MKCLVHTKPYILEFTEVPDPVRKEGEVLVQIEAVGICGSDVHGFTGKTGRRIPPVIMGHEAAGIVVEVGSQSKYSVGDKVTFDSTIYCGHCEYCLNGKINLCLDRRVFGVSCKEYKQNGAMADYLAVPERIIYELPDTINFVEATMIETASVAFHAVSLVKIPSDKSFIAVIGCGVIGLMIIQFLRKSGCENIVVVDIDENRLNIAKMYGAKETIDSKVGNPQEKIIEICGDYGVDLVFEAVGLNETVELAIRSVKRKGKVVLIGNVSSVVKVPLQKIVTSEITIFGSCASAGEYADVIEQFSLGKIDVKNIIGVVAPLAEGERWFKNLLKGSGEYLKVVLLPQKL